MAKKLTFQVTIWKEGKYYIAQCMNVEVSSFGETKKEAIANLTEALELYLDEKKVIKITKIEKPSIESLSLTHA